MNHRIFLFFLFSFFLFFNGLGLQTQGKSKPPLKNVYPISQLTPELITLLHFEVNEVPDFPEDSTKYHDVKNWPVELRLKGQKCKLRLMAEGGDYIRNIKNISEVKKGEGWSAEYECKKMPDRTQIHPACSMFFWMPNGRLKEKSFMSSCGESPETYLYQYYPDGELLLYQYRTDQMDIGEYFDLEGKLVGFRIYFNAKQRANIYNWEGINVESEIFTDKLNQLY